MTYKAVIFFSLSLSLQPFYSLVSFSSLSDSLIPLILRPLSSLLLSHPSLFSLILSSLSSLSRGLCGSAVVRVSGGLWVLV